MSDFKENTPQLNSVSTEQFLNVPVNSIQIFDWKSPVTRQNFISWLETSFKVSQGQPEAQYYFFEWGKVNLGIDYEETLDNFFSAYKSIDSWNFLSSEEMDFFAKRFRDVIKHKEAFLVEEIDVDKITDNEVFYLVLEQVEDLKTDFKIQRGKYIKYPWLNRTKGMSSDEFGKEIAAEVTVIRQRQNELG